VAEVAIGRLTLKFSGAAPAHPERLATLIAQALAQAPTPAVARELGAMALTVAAAPGDDDAAIAARIAAQMLARLRS
jgi:hypothetical protein